MVSACGIMSIDVKKIIRTLFGILRDQTTRIIICAVIINAFDADLFHSTLDEDGHWWEPVRVEKCEDVLAEAGF